MYCINAFLICDLVYVFYSTTLYPVLYSLIANYECNFKGTIKLTFLATFILFKNNFTPTMYKVSLHVFITFADSSQIPKLFKLL